MKQLINKILIKKSYCGEDISDIEEDVFTAIDYWSNFAGIEEMIPVDEDGFSKGKFRLLLTWDRDDNN